MRGKRICINRRVVMIILYHVTKWWEHDMGCYHMFCICTSTFIRTTDTLLQTEYDDLKTLVTTHVLSSTLPPTLPPNCVTICKDLLLCVSVCVSRVVSAGPCLHVQTAAAEWWPQRGRLRGDLDPFNIPRVQHFVEIIRGPSRHKNLTHASILP